MPECAAERHVLERAGEGADRVELTLQIERRHHVSHRPDVDAARFHGKRLKPEIVAREVHRTLPLDLRLGPTRYQGIAE